MIIKKISWWRRLFWNWNKLEQYFMINNKDSEKMESLEKEKEHLKIRNDDLNLSIKDLRQDKEDSKKKIEKLKMEVHDFEKIKETTDSRNSELEKKKLDFENKIENLKEKIYSKDKERENLNLNISERLGTLDKINKTFFDKAGSKGKGELGEIQIENVLEKSGLPKNFWSKNLLVGGKSIEFAIKSGEENKWVPIDSKVIEAEVDEDNKIIIDKKYVTRVKTQVKKIKKYLSKSNTTSYGVLVLQNDSIYITLYEKFPDLFQNTLRDTKIYIASPSSFIQMAWSINEIIDIYDRIENDQDIYNDIMSVLDNVANFANNLRSVEKNFNNAMNSHFPAIEKKHQKLEKKLNKTGKLKSIKTIQIKKNKI